MFSLTQEAEAEKHEFKASLGISKLWSLKVQREYHSVVDCFSGISKAVGSVNTTFKYINEFKADNSVRE